MEGEDAISLESEGRKRANEEMDSRLAKRAKVEGGVSGGETKEDEGKTESLRALLADDPKKLSAKDVEEVIRCLDVEDIINLASQSRQGNGSSDDGVGLVEKWKEGEEWRVRVLDTLRFMLCCIAFVKTVDIKLAYEKWPPKAFGTVLFTALSPFLEEDPLKFVECNRIITTLCGVLPFDLFAHVLDKKEVYSFPKDTYEDETRELQKKAAEECDFCLGKAEHTGMHGEDCTLVKAVPIGTRVPAHYWIQCRNCGERAVLIDHIFEGCFICDWEVGRAVLFPPSFLNNDD